MKISKERSKPETKKRDYARPEFKKRERIKEITEFPASTSLVLT